MVAVLADEKGIAAGSNVGFGTFMPCSCPKTKSELFDFKNSERLYISVLNSQNSENSENAENSENSEKSENSENSENSANSANSANSEIEKF